ncbi:hypothetical protein EVAR_47235_1 [Eumeta japonica]|uniref:Uncharacterized protein n=1 Tax=Eumeta variegata TaxID=151549 RepID=A0A4C1XR44_EUMVA|nr:hypothetical protein EVAR_47235_1 [Eumeta japonica]
MLKRTSFRTGVRETATVFLQLLPEVANRHTGSGGARRRRRQRPPTASRLKGPRKQKSFAYKLLKRGLANLMSPTSTSGVAPPLHTGYQRRESRLKLFRVTAT